MLKAQKDLLLDIVKYIAIALLGAIVAFVTTSFNRLASRALTILPAGIHVLQSPILACADQTFITGEINEYLDTNIRTPPCDVLLSRTQINDLKAELGRAKTVYLSERIGPLSTALDHLQKVARQPPQNEKEFRSQVLQAVANLVYISNHTPQGVPPHELLIYLEKDVSRALKEVNVELDHMQSIIASVEGKEPSALKDHLELYFVVNNSSDIEFYLSTRCSLSTDGMETQLKLEDLKSDEIPVSSLVYLPILPGRGKLLKYSPDPKGSQSMKNLDLSSVKNASISCSLSTDKVIKSRGFNPQKFTVHEKTF
jgi:hypothetical protein